MAPHSAVSSRPLSRRTVARTSSLPLHTHTDRLRRSMSLPCPRSHHPVSRIMSLSCALDPNAGCPNVEPVRHLAHRKVASAACDLAVRLPELARLISLPGLPNNKMGSIHGPNRIELRCGRAVARAIAKKLERPGPARKGQLDIQFPEHRATQQHGAPKQQRC